MRREILLTLALLAVAHAFAPLEHRRLAQRFSKRSHTTPAAPGVARLDSRLRAEGADMSDDLPLNEISVKKLNRETVMERETADSSSTAPEDDYTDVSFGQPPESTGTTIPPPSPLPSPSTTTGTSNVDANAVDSFFTERWEELHGNFVLRPPPDQPARALIHFLGGAFVGAAPHVTYRYLLDGLANAGFLLVATPYRLNFDYLEVCDSILEKFEGAALPLAQEYGALPVIGMGHSCGALLQVYITCLFPDTPRAANVLISFNNKPAKEAIPAFEELVTPVASAIMANSTESTRFRSAVAQLRDLTDTAVSRAVEASPPATSNAAKFLAANFQQSLELVDQIPGLLTSIADGITEFTPTPDDTRESCRRMYRARRTLLVKFENDAIDESDDISQVLQEAKDIMRLKRPMVAFDIRLETITGTHITPLTQDVFVPTPLDSVDPLMPLRTGIRSNFLQTIDDTQGTILRWLDEV